MTKFILTGLAAVTLILGLCSCASISVQKSGENNTPHMPKRIYVSTFNIKKGEFNVDREKTELTQFKESLQTLMQASLVDDLNRRLVVAVASKKGHEFTPEDGWLIRGEFTKVNQGSRFLRCVFGLGAGGTKMETKIYVYDLTENVGQPILTFTTTGGSGAEPGAITALGTGPYEIAGQALVALGAASMHGVTEDTRRTAREVTAELSDYMYKRGWITQDKWIKPKNLSNSIQSKPVKSSVTPATAPSAP